MTMPASSVDHASIKPSKAPVSGAVYGTLINLSGRRRVTSQRVILFAVLASMGHDGALDEAQTALNVLKETHQLLVNGNRALPGVFSEQLLAAYFGPLQGDQQTLDFMSLAQATLHAIDANTSPAPALLNQLVGSANPILMLFNQLTLVYEEESHRYAQQAKAQVHALMSDIQAISREARIVSVNAQIIAAQAGADGRTFSVVARSLSDITERIDQLARTALNTSIN